MSKAPSWRFSTHSFPNSAKGPANPSVITCPGTIILFRWITRAKLATRMRANTQTFGPARKFHQGSCLSAEDGNSAGDAELPGLKPCNRINFLHSAESWNKLAVQRVLLERLIEFASGGVKV
jgi:hypothetical protein